MIFADSLHTQIAEWEGSLPADVPVRYMLLTTSVLFLKVQTADVPSVKPS